MAPDLHQSAPHSVQDMDEQRRFTATGTTVPAVSGELRRMRRGDSQQHTDSIAIVDMTVNDSDQERDRAHRGEQVRRVGANTNLRRTPGEARRSVIMVILVKTLSALTEFKMWKFAEVVDATAVSEPVVMEPRVRAPVTAFSSMDAVNLTDVFANQARVMRSVPAMLKGAFRSALRVALKEIVEGVEANNNTRETRAWKLLLLLPRVLLFRPSRGGLVPRKKLESRFAQFQAGQWVQLLDEGTQCAQEAHSRSIRRSRRNNDEESQRAARALSRVQLGELSAARQALEELHWHLELWRHWQLSQTHRNARHNPGSPSANGLHRQNLRSNSSWIPMHFQCACGSPDEVLLLGRQG